MAPTEKKEAIAFARDIQQGRCLVTTYHTGRLSEAEFMGQVIDLAHLCGWMTFHPFDSRRSCPGWPDVAFCHPGRHEFFLAELKSQQGKLSPAQQIWIEALRQAGVEVVVWRPSDLDTAIVARLTSCPQVHNEVL